MSEAQFVAPRCGIYPMLDRVLVKPDEIEETTESGLVIPTQVAERHQQAQATGTLVAVGPDAFVHSRVEVFSGKGELVETRIERYSADATPRIGDRVLFAKFGGLTTIGMDGEEYRVLNDRDITGLVDHGVTYTGIESRKPMNVNK